MNGGAQPGSLFDPHLYSNLGNRKAPLGKMVSQLELSDPEARLGLQKILDVQMKEKRDR